MKSSLDRLIFKVASVLLAIFSGWLVFRFGLIRFDRLFLSALISLSTVSVLLAVHLALIIFSGRGMDKPVFNGEKFRTNLLPIVLSALKEELIFRGAILSGLTAPFGWVNGIAFSSLIFAVIHAKEPGGEVSFWFSLALGVGLGSCVFLTGDLIFPVLAHSILNWLTISIESRPRSI